MSSAVESVAEDTGMSEESIIKIAHKLSGQSTDDEDTCPVCGDEYMYEMTKQEMFGDNPPSPIINVSICIGNKSAYLHSNAGDQR